MSRPLSLSKLQEKLIRLRLEQKHLMLDWLQRQIEIEEAKACLIPDEIPIKSGRVVVAYQGGYRQELVRCGKAGCKCGRGELHGPYWYRYWREDGDLKCAYIGKQLPSGEH